MATCGYVCPACEGRGFDEEGKPCSWCTVVPNLQVKAPEITDEEWVKEVHEGKCCSDE